MKIQLNKKSVYNFSEPYIIAEIGSNHNGDMKLAKKLIDSAKKCGVDAVKFQSWNPNSLIAQEEYSRNQTYDDSDGGKKHFGSLREMVEKYYLRKEQHYELKEYCDNIGIDFCSTPFSNEEVDLLIDLDIPFIKVASMDINNIELLKYIASKKKPVVLSTGMATMCEIERAIKTIEIEGNTEIIILHCVSIYPPDYKDINLRNITMLQHMFDYPVGFSDHTIGTSIPLASVALGSAVIEKHFTLDKDLPGWDHAVSADPRELEEIVRESKNITMALGKYKRFISLAEEEKKAKFRRSIVSTRKLVKGKIIQIDDITFKRPGIGIQLEEKKYVIGRTLKRDINEDELIKWDDLL